MLQHRTVLNSLRPLMGCGSERAPQPRDITSREVMEAETAQADARNSQGADTEKENRHLRNDLGVDGKVMDNSQPSETKRTGGPYLSAVGRGPGQGSGGSQCSPAVWHMGCRVRHTSSLTHGFAPPLSLGDLQRAAVLCLSGPPSPPLKNTGPCLFPLAAREGDVLQ